MTWLGMKLARQLVATGLQDADDWQPRADLIAAARALIAVYVAPGARRGTRHATPRGAPREASPLHHLQPVRGRRLGVAGTASVTLTW